MLVCLGFWKLFDCKFFLSNEVYALPDNGAASFAEILGFVVARRTPLKRLIQFNFLLAQKTLNLLSQDTSG
jgi:hypothetical protein